MVGPSRLKIVTVRINWILEKRREFVHPDSCRPPTTLEMQGYTYCLMGYRIVAPTETGYK